MSQLSDEADRQPHRVDIKVGEAIRARRKVLCLSQEYLAGELGISFQQVQKYERGSNRISASMLYKAATALKAPIEYFFNGVDDDAVLERLNESHSEQTVTEFLKSSEGIELAQAFPKISNPAWRRKVAELVKTLAAPHDTQDRGRKKQ